MNSAAIRQLSSCSDLRPSRNLNVVAVRCGRAYGKHLVLYEKAIVPGSCAKSLKPWLLWNRSWDEYIVEYNNFFNLYNSEIANLFAVSIWSDEHCDIFIAYQDLWP